MKKFFTTAVILLTVIAFNGCSETEKDELIKDRIARASVCD